MGVYKRGDTWGISYFHNGKRIRKTIGANKKKAEAELEAIRVDIRVAGLGQVAVGGLDVFGGGVVVDLEKAVVRKKEDSFGEVERDERARLPL